jgi:hypothetical protein
MFGNLLGGFSKAWKGQAVAADVDRRYRRDAPEFTRQTSPMLMTWIEMVVLILALGGVVMVAWPAAPCVWVGTWGRLIPGRRVARLERARFVRYAPHSECSFPEGL